MYCVKKYIKWKLNTWNDILAYIILIIQVIFEHIKGHGYIAQVVVFISLLLIYRVQLLRILRMLKVKMELVLKRGAN